MTTPTTNYAWLKPVIGADANTWGTESNAVFDAIDAVMFGKIGSASPTFTGTVAGAALSFTGNGSFGGTLAVTGAVAASGVVTISQGGIGAGLVLNQTTPATYNVDLNFNTSGAQRWVQSVRSAALTYDMWFFSNSLGTSVLTLNNTTGVVSAPYGITANVTGNLTGNATTATTATNATNATNSTTQAPGTNNLTIATTAFVAAATPGAPATATTSVNGITTLATGAQVVAGTDTTHAVTPASLTSQQSLAANGYYTLPGGAIEQWGVSASISNNGSGSVTFPLPFTSALYSIVITPTGSAGTGGMAYAYIFSQGVSGFSIFNAGGNAVSFYWRAVGK